MFNSINLCSTPGEVDPILELYYRAAICHIIQKQTKVIRELPEIHNIKLLVPIGSGDAVQPENDIMFINKILLTHVEDRLPATELKATAPKFWLFCMKHLLMELDCMEIKQNSWTNVLKL